MSGGTREPESTLDRIIGERRDKAAALRGAGRNPYDNTWRPRHTVAEVRARYEPTLPPPAPPRAKPDPAAAAAAKIDAAVAAADALAARTESGVAGKAPPGRGAALSPALPRPAGQHPGQGGVREAQQDHALLAPLPRRARLHGGRDARCSTA
jgi:hypothetical protein